MSAKPRVQQNEGAPHGRSEAADPVRLMADYAPVMMWLEDSEGRVVYSNPRWLRFRGRTLDEERGLSWLEGVHPDDRGRCRATQFASLSAPKPFEVDCRLRRADGEHRRVRVYGAPIIDGDRLAGFVGSCIDMTDVAAAQDELLATVSHQLRAPLNGIKSWAHVIENELGETDNPTVRRGIDGIYLGVEQQVRLIDVLVAPSGEDVASRTAPLIR